MSFGKRIEKIMRDKGLNYRTLGILLEYSDTHIGRIVKEESIPRIDFIQQICSKFPDVDLNWLVTGNYTSEVNSSRISSNDLARKVFDEWDELMKDRLFKSNFESKAAIWALTINRDRNKGDK